jgi:hypothetical protein
MTNATTKTGICWDCGAEMPLGGECPRCTPNPDLKAAMDRALAAHFAADEAPTCSFCGSLLEADRTGTLGCVACYHADAKDAADLVALRVFGRLLRSVGV